MSIADLKARFRDVPGIESLTMQVIGGRQVFGCNGLIAAVDPTANEHEIESAIRHAAANHRHTNGNGNAAAAQQPHDDRTQAHDRPTTHPIKPYRHQAR